MCVRVYEKERVCVSSRVVCMRKIDRKKEAERERRKGGKSEMEGERVCMPNTREPTHTWPNCPT